MNNRKRKIYQAGDQLNLRISKKVDDTLLRWINSRAQVGPEIFDVLKKYAKGELVNANVIVDIINKANTSFAISSVENTITPIPNEEVVDTSIKHCINSSNDNLNYETNIINEDKTKDNKDNHKEVINNNPSNNEAKNVTKPRKDRKIPLSSKPTFAQKPINVFTEND